MLRLPIFFILLTVSVFSNAQQHPVTFFTKAEAAEVKTGLGKLPLLTQSYNSIKREVDSYIGKEVDVPVPKDPAGGYTHDKHKANYTLMFNSGILYNLTGDIKYAGLTKNMLLKYAALNPTLQKHPQATSGSPGRIFWQALNDANWMVYAGMAYDLIYNSLNAAEKKQIEEGAFKPEVEYFTKDLKGWFSRLHNHSVWACAGVGIIGIASNNKDYMDMALYGIEKDGQTGFIAQMDKLFSPDGYYTEGPYYVRYAILPYMLFANALNNTRPSLKIFEYRNSILKKALTTCLQQTNTNGSFFPLNDALKDKDYTTNEIVTAINIAQKVYGSDKGFLTIARKQNRVMLTRGGASIASAIMSGKNIPAYYPYATIESTDGINGDEGGISIFRNGKEDNLTSLIFKYASQGLGHGHFDRLNINLFDNGNEILSDYGSARFIGIEQKYGGRYLPENEAYAAQTIAHNTIVIDETSHFDGKSEVGEKSHAVKLFSDITNPAVLAVAAKEEKAYKDVQLQRNLYMLQLPDGKEIIADIFNVVAEDVHQYDLPFQYSGQFISTSFKYNSFTAKQETLGNKNGYQFLWKEAEASVKNSTVSFTLLNNKSYYTISSLIQDSAKIYFTRSGANDPNFNLRREPAFIIRKNGASQAFVNVIEIHGKYDPVNEFSSNAYTTVKQIQLLQYDAGYTVATVTIGDKKLMIAQSNSQFGKNDKHTLTIENSKFEWNGPFLIQYDGKPVK
jgi:oligo-alginate lyase